MKHFMFCLLLQASIQSYRTVQIRNHEFKPGRGTVYRDEAELKLINAKGTIYSDSFAKLPNSVKELYIDEADIEKIENGALCSHPFEKITIYGSRLPTLTREMLGDCPSLKEFKLSNDNNSTGDANFSPDMFSGLPNLKRLFIHDAWKFPHMSKKFVENSTSLRDFQVAGSNLKSIEAGTLDNLVNLEWFRLWKTNVESVDGLFPTLKNLTLISVVMSELKSFPWNELRSLPKVNYIVLIQNKIDSFDGNLVVENVPGLTNLTFGLHPIPCEKLKQEVCVIHKTLPKVDVKIDKKCDKS